MRARPPLRDVLKFEPGSKKRGWQHEIASCRSLSTSPTSHLNRLRRQMFRTSCTVEFANFCPCNCWCGHSLDSSGKQHNSLDSSGHHREVRGRRVEVNVFFRDTLMMGNTKREKKTREDTRREKKKHEMGEGKINA